MSKGSETNFRVVCEHDGDCQETAVARVQLKRPVFLSDHEEFRLCREHALDLARSRKAALYGVQVDSLDQGELAFG